MEAQKFKFAKKINFKAKIYINGQIQEKKIQNFIVQIWWRIEN